MGTLDPCKFWPFPTTCDPNVYHSITQELHRKTSFLTNECMSSEIWPYGHILYLGTSLNHTKMCTHAQGFSKFGSMRSHVGYLLAMSCYLPNVYHSIT